MNRMCAVFENICDIHIPHTACFLPMLYNELLQIDQCNFDYQVLQVQFLKRIKELISHCFDFLSCTEEPGQK